MASESVPGHHDGKVCSSKLRVAKGRVIFYVKLMQKYKIQPDSTYYCEGSFTTEALEKSTSKQHHNLKADSLFSASSTLIGDTDPRTLLERDQETQGLRKPCLSFHKLKRGKRTWHHNHDIDLHYLPANGHGAHMM